jgi:hypothetical protein
MRTGAEAIAAVEIEALDEAMLLKRPPPLRRLSSNRAGQ